VTILIDARSDGVRLSYDRTASFLSSYGSEEALMVVQELDSKVEALLTAAGRLNCAKLTIREFTTIWGGACTDLNSVCYNLLAEHGQMFCSAWYPWYPLTPEIGDTGWK
jgi:hypothetical protein